MGHSPIDAVVAGSKSFALALFAPLTERVGVRPRIAAEASQAGAFLPPEGGLAVVEYLGDDTLRAIEALLRRPGVRVVAAVAPPHAAAEERLRALGADAAHWDGAPAGVLGAVARQLSPAANRPAPATARPKTNGASVTATSPAPHATPRPATTPAAAAAIPPTPALVAAAAPASATSLERRPPPPTPAAPQPVAWPCGGASAQDLEDALARGLAGLFDAESPLRAVTEQVVQGLSPLEREILSGDAAPVDADTLRKAALMRLRVAAALASAPAPGAPIDAAAVSSILVEIDALLSRVGALVQSAAPEQHGSLETVRNALVKEAIDFSEAAQRLASADAAVAPKVRAAVARARVLSVERGEETEARRPRVLLILLALSLLGGAAFHGVRLARREGPVPLPTITGAPSDAVALAGRARRGERGMTVVRSLDGRAFTPEEIATLAEQERLKGNAVREVSPGVLVVLPPGAQPDASEPHGR